MHTQTHRHTHTYACTYTYKKQNIFKRMKVNVCIELKTLFPAVKGHICPGDLLK